jgi:hypothetical protein
MKEGKLSSALMERYGISEEDSHGQVLWHSLNESGDIDIYDMKFGSTIIRNLLAEDINSALIESHGKEKKHGKRDVDDPKRGEKE